MPVGGLEFFRLNENAEERMLRKKDRERVRKIERSDKVERERWKRLRELKREGEMS
ncbi:MAG: hypothetical protein ACK56F_01810 [bacterium]